MINSTFAQGHVFANASEFLFLPTTASIMCVVYIAFDLFAGLFSNILLVLIIFHSPSLRTPPNSHLVNICFTNLVLCISMILSIVSMLMPEEYQGGNNTLLQIELFCVTTCSTQYLLTFAAIGFYRNKTMQRPHLSLKYRKSIVSRSIVLNWFITQILSLILTMSFNTSTHDISRTLNPFQPSFEDQKTPKNITIEQLISIILLTSTYVIACVVVFRSYYNICRTLNMIGSNRVSPTNRNFSLTVESVDESINKHQYAQGKPVIQEPPYCISQAENDVNVIVHFRRDEHELSFEDILALENPILANSIQDQRRKRVLQLTLSNSSANSTKTNKWPDFSDISPKGELHRFQAMKNNNALCKQSLRRDRINLSSATKNSMVMVSAFALCSLPLFIVSIPGCLGDMKMARIFILLFCRLLFYLNVCIYPAWYLLFCKRVKKCMSRLYESMLIKLHLRP